MTDPSNKDETPPQPTPAQRAEDGKKAMSDYLAAQEAERAKTARLREARLAKEAAEAAARPAATPKKVGKAGKAGKAAKAKPVALSDWLDDQKTSGRSS